MEHVEKSEEKPQTLHDHVRELRRRLLWPALVLVGGGFVSYYYHKQAIEFLKAPLHESLYYTSPTGGFNFVMKICFMVGLLAALPVLIYNLTAFIQPAFAKHISQQHIRIITLFSLLLAIGGGAFAFFVVVPMSLHFFKGFQTAGINSLIAADDYLNFVVNITMAFILIFQIPIVVLGINRIKPLSPRTLFRYEKYVIVGSLIFALLLPFTYDPLTQFLVAIPIIVLYNLSLLLVISVQSRAKTRTKH